MKTINDTSIKEIDTFCSKNGIELRIGRTKGKLTMGFRSERIE